jgi:hypothetical protein
MCKLFKNNFNPYQDFILLFLPKMKRYATTN